MFFGFDFYYMGGEYAMQSKRIARLVRESFLNEPLFEGFTDIRKKPVIPLRTILMSA